MPEQLREHREAISTEVNGQRHSGTMIIRGARKLTVSVNYLGREETDSRAWGTSMEEQHNMRVMALELLIRMVTNANGTPD